MYIILLGPPGCGKGTQAQILKDRYGLIHLSTGDLLRQEIAQGTELGKMAQDTISKGGFLPDPIIIDMVHQVLERPEYKVGIVFDGFPRTLHQAEELDRLLENKHQHIDHVIEFDVDEDLLVKRITGRFMCNICDTSYNDYFKPTQEKGVCDVCGSHDFKRRSDDTMKTIKERLKIYHEQTQPLIPYYAEKGVLDKVDGMADVKKIAEAINIIIEKRK